MRLAFVDTLFSWPPHGGACTDLFYTARELQAAGHDVHVFMTRVPGESLRGGADIEALPFPATVLTFGRDEFAPENVPADLREVVDAYAPEAVFVCDAFFMKPALIEALAGYPLAARYYAYEAVCPRDFRRFLDGARCPKDYLSTPDFCRRCAVDGMAAELKSGMYSPWVNEFVAMGAYMPGYYDRLRNALKQVNCVIVYNEIQRDLLTSMTDSVHIVPGGVDLASYPDVGQENDTGKFVVLMTGRVEDPAKGASVLIEAANLLREQRNDFELWLTSSDPSLARDYLRPLGWKRHDELLRLYRQADVCVVPSVWHEPFGMVAVEAMAAGCPVVAADGGGLTGIVEDGETGYLYPHKDGAALAEKLGHLMDDESLRRSMGEAGRRKVEEQYDWPRVIERHYPAILERLGL